MTKLKKNGEKGTWFSFPCLTVKSVWITFCNELSVTWFACLQLEIMWGTLVNLLRKWFFLVLFFVFLSFVLWSRLVTRVTYEAPQRDLLLRAWSRQQEGGQETDWVVLEISSRWHVDMIDLWPRSQTGYLKAPYLLWHWNQSWFICTGCLMFKIK
jgi:hypothetical protein